MDILKVARFIGKEATMTWIWAPNNTRTDKVLVEGIMYEKRETDFDEKNTIIVYAVILKTKIRPAFGPISISLENITNIRK